MGNRGKDEEMTGQKTNREAFEPNPDAPEAQDAVGQDTMGKPAQKPEVRLGREAQARIGQQLRDMYQTFVQEGVPPNLADLVHRLSDQD